jgi:hypothetical protein
MSNIQPSTKIEESADIQLTFDQRYATQRKDWIGRWAFMSEEEDIRLVPMMRYTGGDRFFHRNAQISTVGLVLSELEMPRPDIDLNPHMNNNEPPTSNSQYHSIDDVPQLEDLVPDLIEDDDQSSQRNMIAGG